MDLNGFRPKHIAHCALILLPLTAMTYFLVNLTNLSSSLQVDVVGAVDAFLFVTYVRYVVQYHRPLLKQILIGLQTGVLTFVSCALITLL
jgi:hypothetical protein